MKNIITISVFLLVRIICFAGTSASNPIKDESHQKIEKLQNKVQTLETKLAVLEKGDENISSTVDTWKWVTGLVTATVLSIVTILLIVSWVNARNIARKEAREEVQAISEELLGQLKTTVQDARNILEEIRREKK